MSASRSQFVVLYVFKIELNQPNVSVVQKIILNVNNFKYLVRSTNVISFKIEINFNPKL